MGKINNRLKAGEVSLMKNVSTSDLITLLTTVLSGQLVVLDVPRKETGERRYSLRLLLYVDCYN